MSNRTARATAKTATATVAAPAASRPSAKRPRLRAEDHPGDDVGAAELARKVAENLRRLRKERDLSLDALAQSSGVSRAALSQIECSKTNPTLAVLWKVAVGLGVPFQEFLGQNAEDRVRLLRAGDATPLRSADGRMESRLLSPAGTTPGIELYELRFLPKGLLRSEPHSAGTHETLVVLTGAMRITVDGEAYDLAPGDVLSFRADTAHAYENRSTHEARCMNLIAYGRSG